MRWTCAPTSSRRFFMRSWVMGRGVTTPWSANAIAAASAAPIQIGRYRSPSSSLSSTIGWLVGSSTRTPARLIRIMGSPGTVARGLRSDNFAGARGTLTRGQVRDQQVGIGGERLRVDRDDVREVPVALLVVESVADDETVGTIEADVANAERRDPPDGLVEERAHLERFGLAGPKRGEQVGERESGVDDVLHDEDVPPPDVAVEVLEDPDDAGGTGRASVRGDRHELHPQRQEHRPEEVGEEDRAALQDGDQHGRPAGVVPRELSSELLDALTDLLAGEEDRDLGC